MRQKLFFVSLFMLLLFGALALQQWTHSNCSYIHPPQKAELGGPYPGKIEIARGQGLVKNLCFSCHEKTNQSHEKLPDSGRGYSRSFYGDRP